jgi:kynurenine formamidase
MTDDADHGHAGEQQGLSNEEWRATFDAVSNWGRWGSEDVRGTLNLIGPNEVAAAVALVEEGRHVSCGRDVEFGSRASVYEAAVAPLHFMSSTGGRLNADGAGGATDWVGFDIHGLHITHLDAPSHQFWNGTMFNGHTAAAVTAEHGARLGSVELAADGIVGRGVLVDVAAALGVDWLPEGYAITPDDLDRATERQGTSVVAGDVVMVRTGYGRQRRGLRTRVPDIAAAPGHDRSGLPHLPGLSAAALPWCKDHDIGVVGTDTGTDASPSDQAWIAPFHVVAMWSMGLWVLDNFELEELSRTCDELGRYEFMVVVAPIRFRNTSGSPVNPIAIF